MNEELKEIYKKVLEIQKLYYKAYPKSDYLAICIEHDYISINNEYWQLDNDDAINIKRFKGENKNGTYSTRTNII